jgi:hypothetical protein
MVVGPDWKGATPPGIKMDWPKTEPPSILPPGEGSWKPPAIVTTK